MARAACANVGVVGRRGFALEPAAARVCREAGARVSVNQFVLVIWTSQPRTQPTRAGSKWWRMAFRSSTEPSWRMTPPLASLSRERVPHALCAEAAVSCARAPRPSGQDPTRQGSAECLASLAALCISSGQLHASFSGSRQDWWIRTSPREGIWQCACDILQIEAAQTDTVRSIALHLPLVLGGLGLRSAERVSSACLTGWAHCIRTIDARVGRSPPHAMLAGSPRSRKVSGKRLGVEPTIMVHCPERCWTTHPSARGVGRFQLYA